MSVLGQGCCKSRQLPRRQQWYISPILISCFLTVMVLMIMSSVNQTWPCECADTAHSSPTLLWFNTTQVKHHRRACTAAYWDFKFQIQQCCQWHLVETLQKESSEDTAVTPGSKHHHWAEIGQFSGFMLSRPVLTLPKHVHSTLYYVH